MTARETGFFLCEGGTVIEMDLPLPEVMQDKVTKGLIRRVADADGSPFTGDADGGAEEEAEPSRPAKSATKAAWADWAVAQGADRAEAEKATKDDLIAAYGDQPHDPDGGGE